MDKTPEQLITAFAEVNGGQELFEGQLQKYIDGSIASFNSPEELENHLVGLQRLSAEYKTTALNQEDKKGAETIIKLLKETILDPLTRAKVAQEAKN